MTTTYGTDEATGRPLRDVYSVTLGVALALAVGQVIDVERAGSLIQVVALLPFLAFMVLVFSLYHWAVRFIDVAHSDNAVQSRGAIVTSMAVGSIELIVVLVLAVLVSDPRVFLVGFAGALGFEVLAGLSLYKTGAYGSVSAFGRRYLMLNGGAFLAAAATASAAMAVSISGTVAGAAAFVISALRSLLFYRSGFDLLFGSQTRSG